MTIGELWVAHPFFPWLIIILAGWVGCSTAVMVRSWVRIQRLERCNKLLQEIAWEGVEKLARRITFIKNSQNRILGPPRILGSNPRASHQTTTPLKT